MNNGGFHQFFFNSSGEIVPETLNALSEIGAPLTRALLERAVGVAFPTGYPVNPEVVAAALAEYDDIAESIAPLDSQFFEYAESLSELVNAYLARGT